MNLIKTGLFLAALVALPRISLATEINSGYKVTSLTESGCHTRAEQAIRSLKYQRIAKYKPPQYLVVGHMGQTTVQIRCVRGLVVFMGAAPDSKAASAAVTSMMKAFPSEVLESTETTMTRTECLKRAEATVRKMGYLKTTISKPNFTAQGNWKSTLVKIQCSHNTVAFSAIAATAADAQVNVTRVRDAF